MNGLQRLSKEELETLSKKDQKALRAKRFRDEKVAQGLCTRCGVQPLGTSNPYYCNECHEKAKAACRVARNAKITNWRDAGLCIGCGGRIERDGYSNCDKCLDRQRKINGPKMLQLARDRRASSLCVDCGDPVTTGKARCEPCRVLVNAQVVRRLRAAKLQAITYLGGCCVDCGLVSDVPQVYDFHHLDPSQKDMKLSTLVKRGFEAMCPELDKCVLLCANCHRIRHANNPSFEEQPIDEEVA